MSASNGVIRIGKKGIKKFAFGEDGQPFDIDVVVSFQEWIRIDEGFRMDDRTIPTDSMKDYHEAAVEFVHKVSNGNNDNKVTTAEALDFIARLREQYDELADFFRPKLRGEPDSPDSSGVELRFSAEEEPAQN